MEKTPRLNFNGVTALLVEGDRHSVSFLSEILRRFGLEHQHCVETGAEAKTYVQRVAVDFFFCEAALPDMDGLDLVRWVRRSAPVPSIPIVMLTGYSRVDAIVGARDAGANLVVKKPLSPQVLFDRLAWMGLGTRKFVETETYVGPDRRFKQIGPPDGLGRRSTDLSQDVGEATEPNMTQAEIDAMMKPTKLAST
jgi:DNA-binding response OmpR family regulator